MKDTNMYVQHALVTEETDAFWHFSHISYGIKLHLKIHNAI